MSQRTLAEFLSKTVAVRTGAIGTEADSVGGLIIGVLAEPIGRSALLVPAGRPLAKMIDGFPEV
jgi:hypothetical protein